MELRTDYFKLKDIFPNKAGKYAQKLHVKADEIDYVRKMIPIDPEEIKVKDGERSVIRLITTPRLDRDSDILIPSGAMLDDFRASPSVLFAHDYHSLPVAKDLWMKVTPKGVLAKSQYANHAFAQDCFECVKGGFLNSNSVGFIPVEVVKPEDKKEFINWQNVLEKDYDVSKDESGKAKAIYTKWILLEHSDVPVASNAQSLNLSVAKGDLPIQTDSFKKVMGIDTSQKEIVALAADLTDRMTMKYEVMEEDGSADIESGRDNGELPEDFNTWREGISRDNEEEAENVEEIAAEEAEDSEVGEDDIEIEEDEEQEDIEIEPEDFDETDAGKQALDAILKEDEKIEIAKNEVTEEIDRVEKPETTENYHHVPAPGEEGKHDGHKIRIIDVSKDDGIKGKYCIDCKKIISYMFPADKYSMEEAQAWVSEHSKSVEADDKKIEIFDEQNDDMIEVKENEMETQEDKEEKAVHWTNKTVEVRVLDIPEFQGLMKNLENQMAELKEGRVLSERNRRLIQEVIDSIENALPELKALLKATEPRKGDDEDDIEIISNDADEQKKDDNPELAKLIQLTREALAGSELQSVIQQAIREIVKVELARLKGKVIIEEE